MGFDQRLAAIRIALFDVDGILTDGGLWIGPDGGVTKRFDIRDGAGLKLAALGGIELGLISGHDSPATRDRARKLGIEICYTGVTDKRPAFNEILGQRNAAPEEVLYMGDDILDLPLLRAAGVSVTVPEAAQEVKDACDWVTERSGGHGAVREVCEALLRASGRWEAVVRKYIE